MAPLISAVAYALVVFAVWGAGHGRQIVMLGLDYTSLIFAGSACTASIAVLYRIWASSRRGEPSSPITLVREFLSDRWGRDYGASLWHPALVFVILMTAFSFFKQVALPHAGFGDGPLIAAADRALFGADPWRITHAFFVSPWWTQVIDLAYHAWFAPMMLGVLLCALAKPGSVLAWRYMLAFCLMWIVQGSIMAYAFPAAGPVYFATFQQGTGGFTELTHLLASQDASLRAQGAPGLTALLFQHHLLSIFQNGEVALGGGISAMPSLHNAMAILFACASWHVSPRYGRLMVGYAGIIWIGSIHLGWHYALDGMVALAATMALWKLTGLLSLAAQGDPPLAWRIPLPLTTILAVARSTARFGDRRRP